MNKVIEINDNTLFKNNDELLNGMVLNYTIPEISLPFVMQLNKDKIEELAKRANIKCEHGKLYDEEGNLLDSNSVILNTVVDLTNISERVKENDDMGYTIMMLIKKILENKVLSKLSSKENLKETLSVEDIMAKLYGEGGNTDEKQNSYSR